MRIARLDAPTCKGGEQPWWDEAGQALFYIDNFGRRIHRYDPASGKTRSWETPDTITSLALRDNGGAVVTLADGIYFFEFDSGQFESVYCLPDPSQVIFNDAKADDAGRWLIGLSTRKFTDPPPDGGLIRLDPDGQVTQLDEGVRFSNGPCFSPDNATFYFSDSGVNTCFAYDFDVQSGAISNRRVFVDTTELGGLPDGTTVDKNGCVWMALYGAGKIAAFAPDGKLERTVEMPVKLISSVSFGGPDLDRLYVTTIREGIHGEPQEDAAGSLFVIEDLGVTGLPERRFAG